MKTKATGAEIVVVGAGVIGLSVALELRLRDHEVTVVDTRGVFRQASWAAAGMLAVDDPGHPEALVPLARLSGSLYAGYLKRVEELSGERVPWQTEIVVEYRDEKVERRPERSIDPRQLAVALAGAVRASGVVVQEYEGHEPKGDVLVQTMGAWHGADAGVMPRKGQMLRVQMPEGAGIAEVHHRGDVYVVPRTQGPQAGSALIGATVEDAGFDLAVQQVELDRLRRLAGELLPEFGDAGRTPMLEAWAGLRPGTLDGLPLIGAVGGGSRTFVATGHFRNGILLAPATAVVLADLIEETPSRFDLAAFAVGRFAGSGA